MQILINLRSKFLIVVFGIIMMTSCDNNKEIDYVLEDGFTGQVIVFYDSEMSIVSSKIVDIFVPKSGFTCVLREMPDVFTDRCRYKSLGVEIPLVDNVDPDTCDLNFVVKVSGSAMTISPEEDENSYNFHTFYMEIRLKYHLINKDHNILSNEGQTKVIT